jgi:hypothetical protein
MEPDYLIKMPFINSKGASTLGHTFRYVGAGVRHVRTYIHIYTPSASHHPNPPPSRPQTEPLN